MSHWRMGCDWTWVKIYQHFMSFKGTSHSNGSNLSNHPVLAPVSIRIHLVVQSRHSTVTYQSWDLRYLNQVSVDMPRFATTCFNQQSDLRVWQTWKSQAFVTCVNERLMLRKLKRNSHIANHHHHHSFRLQNTHSWLPERNTPFQDKSPNPHPSFKRLGQMRLQWSAHLNLVFREVNHIKVYN